MHPQAAAARASTESASAHAEEAGTRSAVRCPRVSQATWLTRGGAVLYISREHVLEWLAVMMRWLTPILLLHAVQSSGADHADQQHTLREVGDAHRSRSPCVRADGSANASCFGFHPADSTAALQQAFASGAALLSIDNVGQQQPWVVTPLILENVTDMVVVVEPGVTVLAKEGEFHGGGDCLLLLRNCRNVTLTSRPGVTAGGRGTLRMRRDDYADPSKYLLLYITHM